MLADEDGQILEAHSVSAGLDYPGSGPEHAYLRDSGRARYVAVTDDEALDAFCEVARLEGIIPALESSHALAWALAQPGRRARPDLPLGPRRQGSRGGPGAAPAAMSGDRGGADRGGLRRAAGKRAALMPYLMGGYPGPRELAAIGEAAAAAGADMLELGIPFSDPLADGPVIHAAATRALDAGASVAARARRRRGALRRCCR